MNVIYAGNHKSLVMIFNFWPVLHKSLVMIFNFWPVLHKNPNLDESQKRPNQVHEPRKNAYFILTGSRLQIFGAATKKACLPILSKIVGLL